jgi:hypothetical protein
MQQFREIREDPSPSRSHRVSTQQSAALAEARGISVARSRSAMNDVSSTILLMAPLKKPSDFTPVS